MMRATQLMTDTAQPRDVMVVSARRWRTGRASSCCHGTQNNEQSNKALEHLCMTLCMLLFICFFGVFLYRSFVDPLFVSCIEKHQCIGCKSYHQDSEVSHMVTEALSMFCSSLLCLTPIHQPIHHHRIYTKKIQI